MGIVQINKHFVLQQLTIEHLKLEQNLKEFKVYCNCQTKHYF